MNDPEIKVFPDSDALSRDAAERIVGAASSAIAERGEFSLVLSGGSTPKKLYELLASEEYRTRIDWPRVLVYFGDERCVAPDDPQSNYLMAKLSLLSRVPIPGDNVYRMKGEIDPQEAAKSYGTMLKEKFGEEGGPDMVLLGMGDDGHTASLFPGTSAVKEIRHRCVANYVERFSAWRITMTAPFVNRAAAVMILVAGAEKARRVQEALESGPEPDRLPIQLIRPTFGKLSWLLDVVAAGMDSSAEDD